ncbi:MAG: FmdB family zinc ribbon protein [Chloroflexota bacterium]
MPIYEYYCAVCDQRFDSMRSMSQADEPAPCPNCQLLAGRCASVFAARGSNGKSIAGSQSGCTGCAATSCATCKS